MTNTDRAFIAAFQQTTVRAPSQPNPATAGHSSTGQGPHFVQRTERPRRAKLSELIDSRELFAEAPLLKIPTAPELTIELDSFCWPKLAEQLNAIAKDQLHEILDLRKKVLGFASYESGIGLTTLVVSLAQAATQSGLSVAMLDTTFDGSHFSEALGIQRIPTLREAFESGIPFGSCMLRSEIGKAQLAATGTGWEEELATELFQEILEYSDLVLMDLGTVQHNLKQSIWASHAEGTLLVESENQALGSPMRQQAKASLQEQGAQLCGIIKTQL